MKHKGFLTYDIRDIRKLGTIEECTEKGYFWYWDEAKVGRTFNFGQGTISDMIHFIRNNKQNGFIAIDLSTEKVYNTSSKVDINAVKESFAHWNYDRAGIPTTRF